MKNEHLIPVNIIDLAEKIKDVSIRENERNNYVLRLETTASFINEALMKHRSQKPVVKPNTRMYR
jgi:hypothetical protein